MPSIEFLVLHLYIQVLERHHYEAIFSLNQSNNEDSCFEVQLLAVREVLHAKEVDHFSSKLKLIRIIAICCFSDSNFNLDKQFRSNILTGFQEVLLA